MGAIEGAIIGGVVGAGVGLSMVLRRKRQRRRLLHSLHGEGAMAARQLLDRLLPATSKLSFSGIADGRERMAALALLAEVETIERELKLHHGPLVAVAQVAATGLLGLAVRGDAAHAARRLTALADQFEHEGAWWSGAVKRRVRLVANLAGALAGVPLTDPVREGFGQIRGEGGISQLLIWHAMAQALARDGRVGEAELYASQVRKVTTGFDLAAGPHS